MTGRGYITMCLVAGLGACDCADSHEVDAGPAVDAAAEDATVDAGFDAGPGDAGPGDAGPGDAGAPDAGPDPSVYLPFLCDDGPVPADCPVQTAAGRSSCDGQGAVIFDGTSCELLRSEPCTGMPGAFNSFEACSIACARAGYCNQERASTVSVACENDLDRTCLWRLVRYKGPLALDGEGCDEIPWTCYSQDSAFTCYSDTDEASASVYVRAASLLPFRSLVECPF